MKNNRNKESHFLGMSGHHGYMPGYRVSGSWKDCVESLAQANDLTEQQAQELEEGGYVELSLADNGAEYAEIADCECGLTLEECQEEGWE